jgi:hypothetical protein
MALYTFRDNRDDSIVEVSMKISEREGYLHDNPHFTQVTLSAPVLGDSVRLGLRHHDDGFNDVLKNIKSHHHKSTIDPR